MDGDEFRQHKPTTNRKEDRSANLVYTLALTCREEFQAEAAHHGTIKVVVGTAATAVDFRRGQKSITQWSR